LCGRLLIGNYFQILLNINHNIYVALLNRLMISDLDILDGPPVLDIKPYFRKFKSDVDIKTGWLENQNYKATNCKMDSLEIS